MDHLTAQHQSLEAGRWEKLAFPEQMGNIGSEVSRAIKWRKKDREDRSERAFFRALELMDFTIAAAQKQRLDSGVGSRRLRELCRAREELCALFSEHEDDRPDPDRVLRYYDQFALISTPAGRGAGSGGAS